MICGNGVRAKVRERRFMCNQEIVVYQEAHSLRVHLCPSEVLFGSWGHRKVRVLSCVLDQKKFVFREINPLRYHFFISKDLVMVQSQSWEHDFV